MSTIWTSHFLPKPWSNLAGLCQMLELLSELDTLQGSSPALDISIMPARVILLMYKQSISPPLLRTLQWLQNHARGTVLIIPDKGLPDQSVPHSFPSQISSSYLLTASPQMCWPHSCHRAFAPAAPTAWIVLSPHDIPYPFPLSPKHHLLTNAFLDTLPKVINPNIF